MYPDSLLKKTVLLLTEFVISKVYNWAVHVARMGERRGVYRVLVGKPGGKRQLGRPRRKLEDNIEKDLQKVRCGGNGLD